MYENGCYSRERAYELYLERSKAPEKRDGSLRPYNGRWDYIVCRLCVGCGKPLGRYENLNRLAYCRNCREILFPETVKHDEYSNKRFQYPRPEPAWFIVLP